MILKLMKKLLILGIVLLQYAVVYINLNRFGIFQKFIELEFVIQTNDSIEETPEQEPIKKFDFPYDRVY